MALNCCFRVSLNLKLMFNFNVIYFHSEKWDSDDKNNLKCDLNMTLKSPLRTFCQLKSQFSKFRPHVSNI